MAPSTILNFLKFDFLNNCYGQDSWYVSLCNISSKLVKLLQSYRKSLNILHVCHEYGYFRFFRCFWVKNRRKLKFFSIFELAAVCQLGFKILKLLVTQLHILRCFGVRNRRWLKLFAFLSLYECNHLELTLK